MTFEFDKLTANDVVANMIDNQKQFRKHIHPSDIKMYSRIYKIHNTQGNLIKVYTAPYKGMFKSIRKDMHIIGEGSIEVLSNPHPY